MQSDQHRINIYNMQEEKASGWDFTYLTNTGRMMESPLPWNYFVIICRHLTPVATVLAVKAEVDLLLCRYFRSCIQ